MSKPIREHIRDEHGFTLFELLIVVILIGILAAIALSSLITQQTKGIDADAKSAVVEAAKAMETCGVNNGGFYGNPVTPCDKAALIDIDKTLTDQGTRFSEPTIGTDSYRVTVGSKRAPTEVTFSIRRRGDGRIERECEVGPNARGGCISPGGSGNDW